MIILAVMGLVIMGFILGYVTCNRPSCDLHWDYDIKAGKLSSLETKVFILEREQERLNFIINRHGSLKMMFEEQYYAHCKQCDRKFYSRDFKDKEVAEMLNNITLTSEEIAKKLGFDIK